MEVQTYFAEQFMKRRVERVERQLKERVQRRQARDQQARMEPRVLSFMFMRFEITVRDVHAKR